jgi:general transcription factor 3C polypeptide 5 (transcription factor C subunit 1)
MSSNSKLLELRYRPDDPFCHPVFGDRSESSKLLMRVTCKRKKSDPSQVVQFKTDIVGVVPISYKFEGKPEINAV